MMGFRVGDNAPMALLNWWTVLKAARQLRRMLRPE